MRSHRLDRLARLTQGVALVGLGISGVACGGEPRVNSPHKDEQPHINAPPEGLGGIPGASDAGGAATPAPSAAPVASTDPAKAPTVNAPPPSASGSAAPSAAPGGPPKAPLLNSPNTPKPPTHTNSAPKTK